MTQDAMQLEPCKCGRQATLKSTSGKRGNYFVQCIFCGHTVDDDDCTYTEQDAIRAWNSAIKAVEVTQDAMRMAILKTRKYAGKICIHEVSDEDAQIIWQAAHQSREAEVQRLREALERIAWEKQDDYFLCSKAARVIARQALTPEQPVKENNNDK